MQSTLQDPDDSDSGLIEGSETEEDVEFSHSDEEDVGINGQAKSEDSVHLRFVNVCYPFSYSCGIVKSSFERRTTTKVRVEDKLSREMGNRRVCARVKELSG